MTFIRLNKCKNLIKVLIIMVYAQQCMSMPIIGYHCMGKGMNTTTISLEAIPPCSTTHNKITTARERIQLIQLADQYPIEVNQCKVVVQRIITYCGMHSHSSITRGGLMTYVYPVRRDQCIDAHKTGEFRFGMNLVLSNLKPNSTETRGVTFAGQLAYDGACSGAYYSDQFGEWSNVVVSGSVTMTMTNYLAYIHTSAGTVKLNDGTVCKADEHQCIDSLSGYTFWQTTAVTRCDERKHMVLYEGMADKFIENEYGRDIVTYSVSTEKKSFGLRITDQYEQCQFLAYHTEHPKLIIVPSTSGQFFFVQGETNPSMLDLMAYMNSKFVYVEKALRKRMTELYIELSYQRCEVERKSLMNLQSIASISPSEFAYAYTGRPGVTAVALGEVIHMTYCNPVEVTIRKTDTCYKEMPITYNNQSYYLTPKTRLIQKYGTEIDCDSRLNAWYKIGEDWISFTTTHHLAPSPERLLPNKTADLPTKELHLAVSGIYSYEDAEKLRDKLMNPYERAAITNTITRGVIGARYDPQGTNIYNMFDENALEKIKTSVVEKIWGWFTVFGNFASGMFGVYIVFRIIKFVLDTIIHVKAIQEVYGFSKYIIGGLWDSVTTYLLNRSRVGKTKSKEDEIKQEQVEEELKILTPDNSKQSRDELHPPSAPIIYPILHQSSETPRKAKLETFRPNP